MISDNLTAIRQRIARCCEKIGRSPADVTLVSVTKEAGIPQIEEAIRCGVADIGENRVQDALGKYRVIGNRVRWHLIGHLQTNKVKDAVKIFSLIHSLDSAKLAAQIDKEAKKLGKTQDVLIEVNTSGEGTKFGVPPEETSGLLQQLVSCENINVRGLMTMAPFVDNPEKAKPYFRKLRELRDKLQITNYKLQILSMGMSNDFETAIEEGATMVRIGRAIFKSA